MDAEEGGKKKPDLHRRGVFVAVGCWGKDALGLVSSNCGESLFELNIIPYISSTIQKAKNEFNLISSVY